MRSSTLNSYVGNREIKTSYKTKEEIVDGLSLRATTPNRRGFLLFRAQFVLHSVYSQLIRDLFFNELIGYFTL